MDASLSALSVFADHTPARANPAILLPASVILELSGERVRQRLCVFSDEAGAEYCLRPDMTVPIARAVASGELPPGRYHYDGPVFRLPGGRGADTVEFRQIGFEWFDRGTVEEDAEAFSLTLAAIEQARADGWDIRVGDIGLFQGVIDSLGLSRRWTERLKAAFARKIGPAELIKAQRERPGGDLASFVLAAGETEAVRAVESMIALAGFPIVGGRTAAEIVERLRETGRDQPPSKATEQLIRDYLAIEEGPDAAVDRLDEFRRRHGLNISDQLDRFATRAQRIASEHPSAWGMARFSAQSGRRFEYYDGFVFEISQRGRLAFPLAAGGRYDGLLARLTGGRRTSPAMGAAVRSDRLTEGASE
jgi:ATP phosphoribosyltransferase regulatory subunit